MMDGLALLDAEFARDLFADNAPPLVTRQHAHLFLLAEPLTARPDMLLELTDSRDWQPLLDLRQTGRSRSWPPCSTHSGAWDFSPGLEEMQTLDRRPAGAAMSTYGITPGRTRRMEEGFTDREIAAELEINDNGGLRIYSSRFSDVRDSSNLLLDVVAVGFTRQLIAITAAAAEVGGYLGGWVLGFGATGLGGTVSAAYRETGAARRRCLTAKTPTNVSSW